MNTTYKHRVILVSDMHYTTQETDKELRLIYPEARTSVAAGNTFGNTQKEKIDCVVNDLQEFIEKEVVDAVLVLGDLSIDDYSFRKLPKNYCEQFKNACMKKLPCRSYAIPGNHDSYPNELWKAVFGYDRQYSIKIGDAAFIMLDTFDSCPASDASGSPYTGIDLAFLEEELKKYPTEQIFLCTHYIHDSTYDEALIKLLNENKRIVCLFDAHTHVNRLFFPNDQVSQCQINVGGYGYQGIYLGNGKWDFNQFNEDIAWGYEILEWNENEAHVYYVKPSHKYIASNGTFDFIGRIENEYTIKF